jgi:hypothetical protein
MNVSNAAERTTDSASAAVPTTPARPNTTLPSSGEELNGKSFASPPKLLNKRDCAALVASSSSTSDEQRKKRMRTSAKRALAFISSAPPPALDSSTSSSDDSSFSAQDSSSDDDADDDSSSTANDKQERDDAESSSSSSEEDERTTRKWALKDLEDICVSSDEEQPDAFVPSSSHMLLLAPAKPKPQTKRSAIALPQAPCIARSSNAWGANLRAMAKRARQSMQPELNRAVRLVNTFDVVVRRASAAQLAKPVRGDDAAFLEMEFELRARYSAGQCCVATIGAHGMYDNMLLRMLLYPSEEGRKMYNTKHLMHTHLCDKQFMYSMSIDITDSALQRELTVNDLLWTDLLLALFGLAILSDDGTQLDLKRKQRLRQSLANDVSDDCALLREMIEKWSPAPSARNKGAKLPH